MLPKRLRERAEPSSKAACGNPAGNITALTYHPVGELRWEHRAPNPKVSSLRGLWIPLRVSWGIAVGMSRRAPWRVPYAESSSCTFATVEARTVPRIYYPRH
jgi:hypothetical protein